MCEKSETRRRIVGVIASSIVAFSGGACGDDTAESSRDGGLPDSSTLVDAGASDGEARDGEAPDGEVPDAGPSGVQTLWSETATVDHGLAGFISFKTSRVELSDTGRARISVMRHGGFSGPVSVDISTVSTTGDVGMTAGVHFTAMSETVSFSDGEAGEKYVDVAVGTSPGAGLHLFLVEMTNAQGGATIHHPHMHVYFDDGGVNPAADVIDGGANFEATVNSAAAGSLVYLREGAPYTNNTRLRGQSRAGYTISASNGIRSAPIVLANYPGESPVIDQNNQGSHDGLGGDVTVGILILPGVHYFHVKGLEIIDCLHSGIHSDSSGNTGIVVEDCHIHNIGNSSNYAVPSRADNIGGTRLDGTIDAIMRNNEIHDIYDHRQAGNNINSVPRGLHSGIHGYRLETPWIHNNRIYNVHYGIYSKHPPQPESTNGMHHVHNNFFELVEAQCLKIQPAGSGSAPGNHFYFHTNVSVLDETTGANVSSVQVNYASAVTGQPRGMVVYGNTQVGGDWLIESRTMDGVVVYDNCVRDAENSLSIYDDSVDTYNNQLEYCDFNLWNNADASVGFFTHRGGAHTRYNTLTEWRDAYPANAQLSNDCGESSMDALPTFVDEGGDDYTTTTGPTVGSGRFGRDIGIGTEMVGIVR